MLPTLKNLKEIYLHNNG
ncbi:hypothetical protein LMP53_01730, partial [Clostridium botulinum]|nr:hypothetical protein [Clostridium botulinum]